MPTLSRTHHTSWQKINYRRANSLLVAEFLHLLYERHNPFVNPVRVSTTVVEFRPWTATSYAPLREWETMVRRTADRFLADTASRVAALRASLDRPRERTHELLRRNAAELPAIADAALADHLVDLVFTPLGDIFEINLVQVEYAIEEALTNLVADMLPPASADGPMALIEQLVASSKSTVVASEDTEFMRLVLDLLHRSPEYVEERLQERLVIYPALLSGYGGAVPGIEDLRHRFREYAALGRDGLLDRLAAVDLRLSAPTEPRVAELLSDPRLAALAGVMQRLGERRDLNKALLGRVSVHRDSVVAEIGRRRGVPVDDLRLYGLEELCALAVERLRVPAPVLELRRTRGVVYRRDCHLDVLAEPVAADDVSFDGWPLAGIPASGGRHTGRAYVVGAQTDITGMRLGDVLVAEGTDFDLGLLLTLAGAVVTEEGGLLSHAAVVAREKRIPCVIRVANAASRIRDGDLLDVDANSGVITLKTAPTAVGGSAPAPGSFRQWLLAPAGQPDGVIGRKATGLLRLADLGFPVVHPWFVLPVDAVRGLRTLEAPLRQARLREIAAEIVDCFGEPVVLRSSGVLEDGDAESAAGIYRSRVNVAVEPETVAAALDDVISSGTGTAASAYFAGREQDAAELAVVVSRHLRCYVTGTASYPGPWTAEHALIEYHEPVPDGWTPVATLVEVPPTGGLRRRLTAQEVLGAVAQYARGLSEHWSGAAVELEWGLFEGKAFVFQGRRIGAMAGIGTQLPPEGAP